VLADAGLTRVASAALFALAAHLAASGASEARQGLAALRQVRRELLIAPHAAAAAQCTTPPPSRTGPLLGCRVGLQWRSGGDWVDVCPQITETGRFAIERPYRLRLACARPRLLEVSVVVIR
jgi:hypothetical protein